MRIFSVLLSILLFSCTQSESVSYERLDIGLSDSLQARVLNDTFEFGNANRIGLCDSLLVIYDEMQEKKIHFFSKETGIHRNEFGTIGQGANELVTPSNWSINTLGGVFSIYDYTRGNLLACPLKELSFASPASWYTISLPNYEIRPREVALLGTEDFVALHGKPHFTIARKGKIKTSYDEFPVLPNHPDSKDARMFFLSQSLWAVKPDGKKIVQVTTLGSIMQILDLQDSTIELVAERYFQQPIFSVQKGQIETLPETIYGFTCLQATDKYIYATLHGVSNPAVYPSTIYKFDWKGNLVKRLLSDQQIVCFTVDEQSCSLYAITLGADNEQKLVYLETFS